MVDARNPLTAIALPPYSQAVTHVLSQKAAKAKDAMSVRAIVRPWVSGVQ